MIGKVENYNPKKGYGFILGDDNRRYYVPRSSIETRSKSLMAGCTVEFTRPAIGNKAHGVRYL